MNKGKVIFLNGLTSCGKTSVSEFMKSFCDDILYVVSNDIFHDMTSWRFFEQDFWKMVAHSITAQYAAVRGMAEAGFNVVIDGMLLDLPEYTEQFGLRNLDLLHRYLDGLDVTYVDFICPPEELRRRNLARGDRGEFQSDDQAKRMTKDYRPDLTIDVMKTMPDESACRILEFCSLPYTIDHAALCRIGRGRMKMLQSLFGETCTVTSLTDEAYHHSGYPVELKIVQTHAEEDLSDILKERGYTELSRKERVITFARGNTERLRLLKQSDGDTAHTLSQLGKTVTVSVDRPAGSRHPQYADLVYPVNYGFVKDIPSGDGEWMDAYIPGLSEPVSSFTGIVSAVLHRFDDNDDKLIVTPENSSTTDEEILEAIGFCEKYFDSILLRLAKQ